MTERPIIFSAPMVRAILEGRKTQTRRITKPQWAEGANPNFTGWWPERAAATRWNLVGGMGIGATVRVPYAVGDRLWVREAAWYAPNRVAYAADNEAVPRGCIVEGFGRKKSSIYMPRWASRIMLEVTAVKIERLNDISEADAKAEGASWHDGRGIGHSGWRHDLADVHTDARSSFARLWTSVHGPGAWEANPWVVAVTFRRVE